MGPVFLDRTFFLFAQAGVQSRLTRYGIAAFAVAAATILRMGIGYYFPISLPFPTYFLAVAVTAFSAGLWPGLVATLLSAIVADYFFLEPIGAFGIPNPGEGIGVATFTGTGVMLSVLAEALLRRNRELIRLREHLSVGQIGSWELNIAGDTLVLSDQARRIFKLPIGSQILPREAFLNEVIDRQDREHLEALWNAPLERGECRFECRIVCAGESKWVRVHAKVERDGKGRPRTVSGTIQEITREKLAEEVNLHLASIVTATSDGIVGKTLDGIVTSWNPGAEEIYGYTAAEMMGQSLTKVIPPEFMEDFHELLRKIKRGETVRHHETERLRKDGTRIQVSLSVSPIKDGLGNLLGVSTIVRDITEHKRAEEAEHRVADYTRSLIEASLDPMVTISSEGKITDVNLATETVTGLTREVLIGSDFCDYFTQPEKAREGYREVFETGSVRDYPLAIRNVSGQIIEVLYNASVLKNKSGEVEGIFAAARDITLRKRAEAEIEALAFYDPLTKLPNRRLLLNRLKQLLTAGKRTGHHAALMFLDLDDFKTLNDTLGHDVGDHLLQQVGERLQECLRRNDTAARFGGDEFVVLLPNLSTNPDEAVLQASSAGEKILSVLERPHQLEGRSCSCTASMGITLFNSDYQSLDEVLKRADIAMYQAKGGGKNRMRFFSAVMQAVVVERAMLEEDLRSAMKEDAFLIHYQPQVDGAGRLIGAEALLRWRHPTRGLLLPAAFLHLAEEKGFLVPIGRWLLDLVCRQLAAWSRSLETELLTLSINVSPREFTQAEFAAGVFAAIGRYHVDPRRLILELTENITLEAVPETMATMRRLRASGVRISLDDFGTGYASLSALKDLPLDQLKLDRSFISNMLTDSRDACIVSTVLALGQKLNLEVIVEGVEREEERRFLDVEGCQFFQGYLFGRPGPVEDLFARLEV